MSANETLGPGTKPMLSPMASVIAHPKFESLDHNSSQGTPSISFHTLKWSARSLTQRPSSALSRCHMLDLHDQADIASGKELH